MKKYNRRKQLIIDRDAQRRQTQRIVLLPLAVLGMAAALIIAMSFRVLHDAENAQAELPSLNLMIVLLMTYLTASGIVMVMQAVRFSHKISGPTYRLKKALVQLREGDFSFRVQLRRGDELIPIADELNRALEWLEAREGVEAEGDQPTDDATSSKAAEAPEPVS